MCHVDGEWQLGRPDNSTRRIYENPCGHMRAPCEQVQNLAPFNKVGINIVCVCVKEREKERPMSVPDACKLLVASGFAKVHHEGPGMQ